MFNDVLSKKEQDKCLRVSMLKWGHPSLEKSIRTNNVNNTTTKNATAWNNKAQIIIRKW